MAKIDPTVVACAGAALIALGVASPAAAREDGDKAGRLYARLGAGVTWVGNFDQDLSYDPRIASTVTPPNARQTETAASGRYAVAIGFVYPAGTRTELEYRYSAVGVDRVTESGGFDPLSGPLGDTDVTANAQDSMDAHFLMSNVYFDLKNASSLTPYIGVGLGGAFVEDAFGQRDSAFAYQGRAGFSLALSDRLSVDLEYLYARTRDLSFGPDDFDDPSPVAGVRVDGAQYQSSSVMASLRLTF